MKVSSLLLCLCTIITLSCTLVSSSVIDAWHTDATIPSQQNLTFNVVSSSYLSNTAYTVYKAENAAVVNGRTDTQLLFGQRDLHIALTQKSGTQTGGALQMRLNPNGRLYQLILSSTPDVGGVFTIVYDAVEGDLINDARLPANCTSSFGNVVTLASPSCATAGDGITLLDPVNGGRDLTRAGTQFAFILPIDAISPSNANIDVYMRVWSGNATSYAERSTPADLARSEIIFEYSRFTGNANFNAITGIALQFVLQPGQTLTVSAFQAIGVTFTKSMTLFDSNEDGIANPGETVQMSVTINKPFIPASEGSWNFQWSDVLSPLVSLMPSTISFVDTSSDSTTRAFPVAGVNSVGLQVSSGPGSPAAMYRVTFLTTILPLANGIANSSLTNNATLNFTLSAETTQYTLTAVAAPIGVSGSPELIVTSSCPAPLLANDVGVITYTVVNNGTIDASGVTIVQTFTPTSSGVISRYDDQWTCTPSSSDLSLISCSYVFPQRLGSPGNFNGLSNEASVNFTFVVSDVLSCSQTQFTVVTITESTSNNITFYETLPVNCSISLLPNAQLAISGSLVGNIQTAMLGDTLFYNINYTNTGNVALGDILITDLIPAGTTAVVPQGADWTCYNESICYYYDNSGLLSVGESRSAAIGLTISTGFTSPYVCNTWRIAGTGPNSNVNCASMASSEDVCVPVLGNSGGNNGTTPTPSPTPVPSASPCVYCLAGSTINISLKDMIPSSCSGGNCRRK